jgi:hypothetical protein
MIVALVNDDNDDCDDDDDDDDNLISLSFPCKDIQGKLAI